MNQVRVIEEGTLNRQAILWQGDEEQLLAWLDQNTIWVHSSSGMQKRVIPKSYTDITIVSESATRRTGDGSSTRPYGMHPQDYELTHRGVPGVAAQDR